MPVIKECCKDYVSYLSVSELFDFTCEHAGLWFMSAALSSVAG